MAEIDLQSIGRGRPDMGAQELLDAINAIVNGNTEGRFRDPALAKFGALQAGEAGLLELKALHLRALGMTLGERTELAPAAFPGAFMVAEKHDAETGLTDHGTPPFVMCADDLGALVDLAWNNWVRARMAAGIVRKAPPADLVEPE